MNTISIKELYNFPIEFKELNHSDFQNYIFEEEKTILTPNDEGYISNELFKITEFDKKDTTVINAGVGQGKTKAIIDIIMEYYLRNISNNENYKIIIITPFKSLNFQYIKKIIEIGGKNDIYFDYQDIENPEWDKVRMFFNARKSIQLISIKSILGDPGQTSFKQNENKRNYYEYLIKQCRINNEKVILFFDELHESLGSFTPELLPNLFKWKEVVHKIFVASATFSESSKTPIKFFAELTNKKIRIIEGKRVQKDNLSELFLCFYNRPTIVIDDFYFIDLFNEILDKSYDSINILTYSENLAEKLYDSLIGDRIKEKFSTFNLCVGGQNKFNKEESNIGTIFKTGISIEKENTVFVVILPPSYAHTNNTFGIFTDRINSLIQSLARPRSSTSSIYVISSTPNKLILNPGNDFNYIEKLSLNYLDFIGKDKQSPYISLNQQEDILKEYYESNKKHIKKEIDVIYNLDEEIRSLFKTYDWFKLKDGDRFLTTQYDIFGKNLSNYFYWAAWNNQFVNCKLKAIIKKDYFILTEGNILKELDNYIPFSMINSESFQHQSDKEIYENLRSYLYSDNIYYRKKDIDGKTVEIKITPSRGILFEQQIIRFLQRRKTPYLFENEKRLEDLPIKREKYIRTCISQCLYIVERSDNFPKEEFKIISAYNDLYSFKDILQNKYAIKNERGIYFLPTDNNFKFTSIHSLRLKNIFSLLSKYDIGFKIFNTKNILDDKSMYSLIRKIFFETTTTMSSNGKCLKINKIIPIEYSEYKLNLVYKVSEPFVYYPMPPDSEYHKIEAIEKPDGTIINEQGNIDIKFVSLEEENDNEE